MHQNAKLTPADREELVRRVLEEGLPMRVVGRQMGVSRRTVWKWVSRFRRGGRAGLLDRSSRPHRIARQLDAKRVARNEWAYRRPYRTSAARTMMLPAFLARYDTRRRHRGIGNRTPHARLALAPTFPDTRDVVDLFRPG
ncbi:MAG: leucine zipper domain-containing protein [Phycisphaerales bacterium]